MSGEDAPRLPDQMREALTEIERTANHASEYAGHPATAGKSDKSVASALRACRRARVPAEPLSRIAVAAASGDLTVRRRLLNDARRLLYEHRSLPERARQFGAGALRPTQPRHRDEC